MLTHDTDRDGTEKLVNTLKEPWRNKEGTQLYVY